MVKKIITKFAVAKKTARSEGTTYRSPRIYLPTKLTDDSTFPFREGDIITVKIDDRKLVVQRAPRTLVDQDPSSSGRASQKQKP